MCRIWPKSLTGQLVVLLLIALLTAQIAVLALAASDRLRALGAVQQNATVGTTINLVRILASSEPERWRRIARHFSNRDLRVRIAGEAAVTAEHDIAPRPLRHRLEAALPDQFGPVRMQIEHGRLFDRDRWRRQGRDDEQASLERKRQPREVMITAIGLPDGRWLNLHQRIPPAAPISRLAWGYFVISAGLIVLVAILALRRVTRPIAALADAAERFGRGEDVPDLPVRGPVEVKKAAAAFNEMQARTRRFVSDRTTMLAAISHDLKTPITTLRLRAEFVEDEENRNRMLDTLDEMQTMIEATLDFARDETRSESARDVDLSALLESVVDDQRALGESVEMECPERVVIRAKPLALTRALRNLLENALRYGERAHIQLLADRDRVRIVVADEGPGIPPDQLMRVLEPFVRLEGSRSRETGGSGLGLAIARGIARAHGGELWLENAQSGLRAIVELPR